MNKQKFLSVLEKFPNITAKELENLEQLAEDYPYFQLVFTLIAKSHKDNKTLKADDKLHKAAIYASDRGFLKSLIETNEGAVIEAP